MNTDAVDIKLNIISNQEIYINLYKFIVIEIKSNWS